MVENQDSAHSLCHIRLSPKSVIRVTAFQAIDVINEPQMRPYLNCLNNLKAASDEPLWGFIKGSPSCGLIQRIWHQREMSRALDRNCQFTLVLRAIAIDTAGQNLSPF